MAGTTITLRLTIADPVAGVAYSLQDKANMPVEPRIASADPISFEHASEWSRRAKIDVHDIPADLLAPARQGEVLEVVLPGRAKDGGPACATVRPIRAWRAI
jgi:hypothetical protein